MDVDVAGIAVFSFGGVVGFDSVSGLNWIGDGPVVFGFFTFNPAKSFCLGNNHYPTRRLTFIRPSEKLGQIPVPE